MKFFESKGLRAGLILFLVFVLSLMLLVVGSLVSERQNRQRVVKNEISEQWSREQQLYGPYIKVPGRLSVLEGGVMKLYQREIYIAPDNISISGNINPQKRKRGIYEVMLYDAKLTISGNFKKVSEEDIELEYVDWAAAELVFGISDMRGLNKNININIGDDQISLKNSSEPHLLKSKLENLEKDFKNLDFRFNVSFRGSEHLQFMPSAANTEISLTSPWSSPSFYGSFLPINHEITEKGFTANWSVLEMNRNIPRVVNRIDTNNRGEYYFGVRLIEPNDNYQKNERAVKYGILIISLTFLGFFFSEMTMKVRVHIIQYGLVGLALLIFYCLLLSFSEIITFNPAYLLSSSMTVILIYAFCRGVFKTAKPPVVIAAITSIAYGFIYVIIQLEDTALLVGSLGLFIILAITMWMSRKVNWQVNNQE